MLSDLFLTELGVALQAQNRLLQELQSSIDEISTSLDTSAQALSGVSETTLQIRELEALMNELEAEQEHVEEEDFADFDPDQVLNLYQHRQHTVFCELNRIGYNDWDSFVRQCQTYALQQSIDPLAPYDIFLTEADLQQLESESYDAQYRWDKWDYIFVGASGVLAALTDYLLVKIPSDIKTGQYKGQSGSPITAWLKKYNPEKSDDWFSNWVQHLSDTCKVPYDAMNYSSEAGKKSIKGMCGKTHRLQALGHDPVLGFIVGVFDILRGSVSGFSYDNTMHTHKWTHRVVWSDQDPIGLIEAILRHIGHLISDVATPAGLPAPFMGLIQGINIGSFGEKNRTVGELARLMYLRGYDFRHFLVSGLTPAVIEIVLRAYIMLRHYSEHGDTDINLLNLDTNPKYRTMLLMAHGVATLGNAGKIALMQGNPLSINYAEWMACFRYLVPSLKYWVFDQHRLRLEHLERINSDGWNQLLQNSDQVFSRATEMNSSTIILGKI